MSMGTKADASINEPMGNEHHKHLAVGPSPRGLNVFFSILETLFVCTSEQVPKVGGSVVVRVHVILS